MFELEPLLVPSYLSSAFIPFLSRWRKLRDIPSGLSNPPPRFLSASPKPEPSCPSFIVPRASTFSIGEKIFLMLWQLSRAHPHISTFRYYPESVYTISNLSVRLDAVDENRLTYVYK